MSSISKPETPPGGKYHHIPVRSKTLFIDDSFRTITLSKKDSTLAVIGKLKTDPTGSTIIQKYLFDVNKWKMDKAKKWVKEHHKKEWDLAVNVFFLFKEKYGIETEDGVMDDLIFVLNKSIEENPESSFFKWINEKEKTNIDNMQIRKTQDGITIVEKSIPIVKKILDKHIVYGEVYVPNNADYHKHFMKAEEIEKTAHNFMLFSRKVDWQHDYSKGSGGVVESFIVRKGDKDFTEGSWVLGTKIYNDKVWNDILKGKIVGYSLAGIAGFGEIAEVETDLDLKDPDEKNKGE